jgi:hypothetical protein
MQPRNGDIHHFSQEYFMSTSNSSLLERFIRVLARAAQSKRERETDRQVPIRWLNLR